MSDERNNRSGRHYVFTLQVHWVFVSKYRRRVFNSPANDVRRNILTDVCSGAQATLVQMDGEDDHVHLLAVYLPKAASART